MKKTAITFSITICLILITSSCNSRKQSDSEKILGLDLALDEMNVEMQLMAPPEGNTFEIGKNIRLVVENLTETPIIFPEGYGIKVFKQQIGEWIPVENDFGYPAGEARLLPKSQQQFGGIPLVLHPVLFDTQPVELRIFVLGKLENASSSDKDKRVGAFINVALKP